MAIKAKIFDFTVYIYIHDKFQQMLVYRRDTIRVFTSQNSRGKCGKRPRRRALIHICIREKLFRQMHVIPFPMVIFTTVGWRRSRINLWESQERNSQVSNVKHVFNASALGKVGRYSVNGLPIIQLIGSSTIEAKRIELICTFVKFIFTIIISQPISWL